MGRHEDVGGKNRMIVYILNAIPTTPLSYEEIDELLYSAEEAWVYPSVVVPGVGVEIARLDSTYKITEWLHWSGKLVQVEKVGGNETKAG